MNAVISIKSPFPEVESIKIYKPFKSEPDSLVYPVKINDALTNIRISKNAMWVDKTFADMYSDEILDFIGNLITSKA